MLHFTARALVILLVVVTLTLGARPQAAFAWKPPTHLFGVAQALLEAQTGSGVSIKALDGSTLTIPVNATIKDALTQFPDAYRAGTLGPDAYPDIFFGQGYIHPDTRTHNDENPGANPPNTAQTYEWLEYLWDRAWDTSQPPATRLKRIAFATGFMGGHAAGDIFAHTWVNHYAEGVFPDFTDLGKADISVRHVVVEGYADKHRPGFEDGVTYTIAAPLDFVADELILSPFARSHAKYPLFNFFFGMQDSLKVQEADFEYDNTHQDSLGCTDVPLVGEVCLPDPTDSPINLIEWAIDTLIELYLEAWIADIDDGLRAWPTVSETIARELFTGKKDIDKDKIFDALKQFALLHFLSMIGLPDIVGETIYLVGEVVDFILDLLSTALDAVFTAIKAIPIIGDLISFVEDFYDKVKADIVAAIDDIVDKLAAILITAALGFTDLPASVKSVIDKNGDGLISPREVIRVLEEPEEYVDDNALFPAGTRAQLDADMHLPAGADDDDQDVFRDYDPDLFAPLRDTTTLAKLSLLDETGLNTYFKTKTLGAATLGDLYGSHSNPYGGWSVPNNVMLGWAKSIDAEYQWRTNSPNDGHSYGTGQMRLWEDCVSRIQVFRKIFVAPVTGVDAFGDAGDPASPLSDTVAPTSTLTLSGPTSTSGGTTYVSGSTQFQMASTDNYWAKPDLRVSLRQFPTGGPVPAFAPPVVADPAPFSLSGADGPRTIEYFAADGQGTPGCKTEATRSASFSVDNTPPTITVVSPLPLPTTYASDAFLSLFFTATDAGAGVDSATRRHFADGVEQTPVPTAIDLFDYVAGDHLYRAEVKDTLGNLGTASVTWRVVVTAASLRNNLDKALARGCITDTQTHHSLEVKLDSAAKLEANGQTGAMANVLGAFVNEISARTGAPTESGKTITPYCANILTTNANALAGQ